MSETGNKFPTTGGVINPNAKQPSESPGFDGLNASRTTETERFYKYRSTLILRKIELTMPPETPVGPTEIGEWFKNSAPAVRPSTARLYKAVMIHYISENVANGIYDQSESNRAIAEIKSVDIAARSDEKRSSSNSAKTVSERNMYRLLERLESAIGNGYARHCAALMFRSTIIAGLRPVEWMTAELVDTGMEPGYATLIVKNAKNTNGRSNGSFRKIQIHEAEQVQVLAETIGFVRSLIELGKSPAAILSAVRQARVSGFGCV